MITQSLAQALLLSVLAAVPGMAGTILHYGPSSPGFPTLPDTMTALPSLNSPIIPGGQYTQIDIVGDQYDAAVYYGSNSDYLFFRVRVHFGGTVRTGSTDTFTDNVWFYIDRVGYGNENGLPDYAFAWDTRGEGTPHGLELLVPPSTLPSSWGGLRMSDADGNPSSKRVPPDFNTTGDGYVRTIDGITTTLLGTTTYIDVAVRWSYLSSTYLGQPITSLAKGQQWRLAIATSETKNDHSVPTRDVAGNATLASSPATAGWSTSFDPSYEPPPPVDTPEPSTGALAGAGLLIGVLQVRRSRRK